MKIFDCIQCENMRSLPEFAEEEMDELKELK